MWCENQNKFVKQTIIVSSKIKIVTITSNIFLIWSFLVYTKIKTEIDIFILYFVTKVLTFNYCKNIHSYKY